MEKHNRIRNKTIAFRISEEEYSEITMLANVSGMQKQEYLISRALQREIIVHPNIRVRKYLEQYLIEIHDELKRLHTVSDDDSSLEKLKLLLDLIEQL